ncbi:antibiotic biosynthesis monooxygenase family protein [Actinomycetota bacterium Odt1-20B]
MSDHPIAPVGPFEPPYYAVVFTSLRTERTEGYAEAAARMDELVRDVPGFLGSDHAQTPGGLSITVSYFRDEESIKVWRANAEHRVVQKRGREEWYETYVTHVSKVERSYRFERE